ALMPFGGSRRESQRDSGLKPRVARNEAFAKRTIVPVVQFSPGCGPTAFPTPTGLRLVFKVWSQPRRGYLILSRCPRVARSSQPLAGRHNPFGIAEPLVRSWFGSWVLGVWPPGLLHRHFQADLLAAA